MKSIIPLLAAGFVATIGASSVAQAAVVDFGAVALGGNIMYGGGATLDTSTAIDLDGEASTRRPPPLDNTMPMVRLNDADVGVPRRLMAPPVALAAFWRMGALSGRVDDLAAPGAEARRMTRPSTTELAGPSQLEISTRLSQLLNWASPIRNEKRIAVYRRLTPARTNTSAAENKQ